MWSAQLGCDGNQFARAVARHASGDILVAGNYDNSLDLGTVTLSGPRPNNGFVVRLAR